MADGGRPRSPQGQEYIPNKGLIHEEEIEQLVLCKPKLMPLKSVTLEKLEKMQKEAENKLKDQCNNNSTVVDS
ncbi:BBSome interacting protein 1 [Lycorma delicatula]|uniref:BBSome interacting protein 1 n=1 Tax=Lycorma delicatula TaxID=130591 RepID=UPI003F50E7E0